MTTRVFLLLTLALTAIQCAAQPIITPYSWTTIAPLQVGIGCGNRTGGREGFGAPTGIAVDRAGNLYVADACNHIIHKVTPVGANWVVTTLAGLAGTSGWVDGTGNFARFNHPTGVAVDGAGNLYVADRDNHSIRMVTPTGVVSTLAGHPLFGYADGPGSAALFSDPVSVAVDSTGNLYVADHLNNVIRKMTRVGTDWQVTTLAGSTGSSGVGSRDGTGPNAQFHSPIALAVDGAGNVYVADYWNDTIRKVTADGVVTTLAGHFVMPVFNDHYGNADGTGAEAQFNYPYGLAVDRKGNVYVADTENCEIRIVTPQGVVTTLGGAPTFNGWGNPLVAYQDGTGSSALFSEPTGVAVDSNGNLYVADLGNLRIRKGVAPVVLVVALEVTQVIQDWRNSVPLIAGKATYVRAHLQLPPNNSRPVTVAGARLYGIGVNGPLPKSPISPINPGARLTVKTANAAEPNVRGHFANSLNFRLPAEWLSGTIKLQLVWPGGLTPINVVSSDCTAEVTFIRAAVPQIKFFDVPWNYPGDQHFQRVGRPLLKDLAQRILSCYPVASVDAKFGTLPPFTQGPPKLQEILQKLVTQRWCDELVGSLVTHISVGGRIYHGATPAGNLGDYLGLAPFPLPSFVSSSQVHDEYGLGRQTAAHEVGHNLGLQHDVALFGETSSKPCGACGEDWPENYVYPLFQPMAGYPNGAPTLGPMIFGDNSLVYGLDTLTLRSNLTIDPVLSCTNMAPMIKDPNCYFDLMSYCRNTGPDPLHPLPYGPEDVWPSIVTYVALLSDINKIFGPPSPALQGGREPKGGGGGNFLVVRGTVDFNAGTAQFLPCLALSTSNAPPAPATGTNFLLQALNGSGLVLQAVEFGLEPSIVERGDPSQTADFIVSLPDDPSIHTLRLWSHGVLLAALSAHAPALTLTTPNGGQNFATGTVSVAWSGSDVDGDALAYTVQYTADDGATWETLAVDWPGQSLEIACSELAATTRGRMRVITSDGFNTAMAQSAATFIVQPHAPEMSINSPPDEAIFMAARSTAPMCNGVPIWTARWARARS